MDSLPGISNVNRKAYMKTAHIPVHSTQQNQELQKMRKYNNLIKQKNYLTAGLLLRQNNFLSEIFPDRSAVHSAPAYTVQDLSKYHALVRLTGTKPRPQTKTAHVQENFPPLYRISHADNGDVEITPHVTLSNLCDDLKHKGLGDPRDQTKIRPLDPHPLIRRRKRQEKKYPFYQEKLKGRALQDMDLTNTKATAFIEQHKQDNLRTASANWRERYNKIQAFDKVSQDSDDSADGAMNFGAWDEDRKPQQLDEQSYNRIETWLADVQQALFPSQDDA